LVVGQNLVVVEAAETCLQRQTTAGLRVPHRQMFLKTSMLAAES